MILKIDTSHPDQVALSLQKPGRLAVRVFSTDRNLSEKLIGEIKKFLAREKVKLSQIKQVEAAPGPGHFSRIRTGVATANALALGLRLPQGIIKEVYSQAPNITAPKSSRLTKFAKSLR